MEPCEIIFETNRGDVLKAFLEDIAGLGKGLVKPIDQDIVKDDEAVDDLNNDDEESPARRRVAFKA